MMLVPTEALWGTADPIARKVSRLDEKMQEILSRTDLDEYSKAKLYQEILQQYLEVKKKLNIATPVQMLANDGTQVSQTTPLQNTPSPNTNGLRDFIIESLPKNSRRKANQLWDTLSRDPDMTWDDKGQMVIHGQVIPGSHAVDLFKDTLLKVRPKNYITPRGAELFRKQLMELNVPRHLTGISEITEPDTLATPSMSKGHSSSLLLTPETPAQPPPVFQPISTRTRSNVKSLPKTHHVRNIDFSWAPFNTEYSDSE